MGGCVLAVLLSGCGKESGLKASHIFDGDSLILNNGQEIRLIGIDAPEKGQPYADEARAFLKGLITGKELRLEKGIEERDKYNRLLVYMYAGDTFVNAEMIKHGYAVAYFVPPLGLSSSKANDKYKEEFTKLEAEAKQTKRLIWSKVYITPNGDKYHMADCKHLNRKDVKAISLSEAKKNYGACKVCKPPE